MSWYIYDSDGYVGDLATNKGLVDLSNHIQKAGDEKLKALFNDGHSRTGTVLDDSIENIPDSPIESINKTLHNFKELIKKCSDIVVITDGTFE